MSDTQKLKKKLSKLADHVAAKDGGTRKVSAAHPYECLTHILDEIGDIVLSRDLLIENTGGQSLSLKVKGRRLIQLNAHAPKGFEDFEELFGKELTTENPDQMAALAQVFAMFCERGSALTFTTSKSEQADSPDDIGLSVDGIREEVIRYTGFEPPEVVTLPFSFLEGLEPAECLAWIRVRDEEVVGSWGDVASMEALKKAHKDTLPHLLVQDRLPEGSTNTPQYWMFGAERSAPSFTVLGSQGRHAFLASIPSDNVDTWIARCHGQPVADS